MYLHYFSDIWKQQTEMTDTFKQNISYFRQIDIQTPPVGLSIERSKAFTNYKTQFIS